MTVGVGEGVGGVAGLGRRHALQPCPSITAEAREDKHDTVSHFQFGFWVEVEGVGGRGQGQVTIIGGHREVRA